MAAVTEVARMLRLDRRTWRSYDAARGTASAYVVVLGAFAVLAFDRLGVQGLLAPRAALRILLAGSYGWLGLAGVAWGIGRLGSDSDADFGSVFRLYGHAHMPLIPVGLIIQFVTVGFQIQGPGLAAGSFALLLWMPALLVAATRQAFSADLRRSLLIAGASYSLWLATVGRFLFDQVRHLL